MVIKEQMRHIRMAVMVIILGLMVAAWVRSYWYATSVSYVWSGQWGLVGVFDSGCIYGEESKVLPREPRLGVSTVETRDLRGAAESTPVIPGIRYGGAPGYRFVRVSFIWVFLLACTPLALWLWQIIRRARAAATCPKCGYAMRKVHVRCPNCDAALKPVTVKRVVERGSGRG